MKTEVQLCRRLWLECAGEHVLGNGMIRLLLEVHSQGSLKKAAEQLKMPYRGAWGRIRKAEEALGVTLLQSSRQRQKGVTLTPIALSLVETFTRIDAECRDFLQERLQQLSLQDFQITLGR
ncbi:MAG: LysR family transcriptional regulator [Desulfovibrio sp.]|nr:LysR family transcriptional regulator [Desulfovibrio sp.]